MLKTTSRLPGLLDNVSRFEASVQQKLNGYSVQDLHQEQGGLAPWNRISVRPRKLPSSERADVKPAVGGGCWACWKATELSQGSGS